MRRKKLYLLSIGFILVCLIIFASGCITMETKFNSNGSGEQKIILSISQTQESLVTGEKDSGVLKEKILKAFGSPKFVKYEQKTEGNIVNAILSYTFNDEKDFQNKCLQLIKPWQTIEVGFKKREFIILAFYDFSQKITSKMEIAGTETAYLFGAPTYTYELTLPGNIRSYSPTREVDKNKTKGDTVAWILLEDRSIELKATSMQVRWWVIILILAIILAIIVFLIYRILAARKSS